MLVVLLCFENISYEVLCKLTIALDYFTAFSHVVSEEVRHAFFTDKNSRNNMMIFIFLLSN